MLVNSKIHVIENFLTWQGELFSGRRCLLLRFKDCNRIDGISKTKYKKIRSCSFCDTYLKIIGSTKFELSIDNIQSIVNDHCCDIIITGGEPTYGRNLSETLKIINTVNNCKFFIETNGYAINSVIDYDKVTIMFSPKIFYNWELEECLELVQKYYDKKNFYVKLVYQNRILIDKFIDKSMEIIRDKSRFYVMIEGKTKEELFENASKTFDIAKKYDINVSNRQHIMFDYI